MRNALLTACILIVAAVAGFYFFSPTAPESRPKTTNSEDADPHRRSNLTEIAEEQNADDVVLVVAPPLAKPGDSNWLISIPEGKARIQNSQGPPTEPLIELYDDLVARGNAGDADAAYYLAKALAFCRAFPTEELAFENEMHRLLTTRRVPWAGVIDDTTDAERVITRSYSICKGVSADQIGQANSFLRLAADGGNSNAQVDYARNIFATTESLESLRNSGDIDVARSYLARAFDSGNIQAGYSLADSELRGTFPPTSKANIVANLIIAGSAFSSHGILQNLQKKAGREFSLLMPEQQNEARRIAQDFIESDRCCHFSYGPFWREILSEQQNTE